MEECGDPLGALVILQISQLTGSAGQLVLRLHPPEIQAPLLSLLIFDLLCFGHLSNHTTVLTFNYYY